MVFNSLELFRKCGRTNVSQPKGGERVGDGWALTGRFPHQGGSMFTPSRSVARLNLIGTAFILVGCTDDPTSPAHSATQTPSALTATTGNGAPSGAHYTLNIIGVPKDESPDFSGGNGHRIFVDLGKSGEASN